jgi:TRAP-type C4-dicarboxylate transport system permease small subunit
MKGEFNRMKKDNKILSILCNLDIVVAGVVLVILIVLTTAGVIFRYILGSPFTWLEEVQLACMVWIVFAAGGAAFRSGNHVAIEMVVDMLPKKAQKVVSVLISVVVVLTLGYLLVESFGFLSIFVRSGRSTPMLHIPYLYIYGIAPVSFVVMIVSYFYSIIKGVKSEAKEALEQ